MVGQVGTGMEEVGGKHVGHNHVGLLMSGDATALAKCEVKTLITSDHTSFQVLSS